MPEVPSGPSPRPWRCLCRRAGRRTSCTFQAIAALLLPDFEVVQEWDGWPSGSLVAIDAAFQRYARSDANGNVRVHQVKGGPGCGGCPELADSPPTTS